jgi:RecB family exonuclease
LRPPAVRVARLLAVARETIGRSGATVEDVLWAVWSRSGLSTAWERRSAQGGAAGAAADRDLDAMVALFEMAATFADRMPGSGPGLFLEYVRGQEIPAETLAPRTPAGEAVAILTAHAAKGLEWDVVCVAGVQEGSWPDVRMRGSFLGSERLVDIVRRGGDDLPPAEASAVTLSRLLAEERRLFYVAVTRARKQLIVTAVESEREGLAPSRFLDELDPRPGADVAERRHLAEVAQPISLVALVAELRQRLSDPATSDDVRTAAAAHLARLAAAGARGADPDGWWGLTDLSDDSPVRREGEVVTVSPSRVDAFLRCELRWFLEQAGGGSSPSTAQTVGTVVHAVAESAVDAASSTEEALLRRLDELLASADLGRGWAVTLESERARRMVVRLAQWLADNPRELVAAEVDVRVELDGVVIRGQVDRLERDEHGRAVVVDFKTGSSKADQSELARNGQLGTYQLAVESGAFAEDFGLTESGGAMLVQLGKAGLTGKAREQAQGALADDEENPDWARDLLSAVSGGMAGASFQAIANSFCSRCPTRVACPLQDPDAQVTR